jgi:formylmethanofuran dehydrogenase subunit E
MAAAFVNLETDQAFRVISTEESRDLAKVYAPEIGDKRARQLAAYKRMPDSVLFRVQAVKVDVPEEDLPGPTRFKATCSGCGQVIRDRREVIRDGRVCCKPCAGQVYYKEPRDVTWSDMNWVPNKDGRRTSNVE